MIAELQGKTTQEAYDYLKERLKTATGDEAVTYRLERRQILIAYAAYLNDATYSNERGQPVSLWHIGMIGGYMIPDGVDRIKIAQLLCSKSLDDYEVFCVRDAMYVPLEYKPELWEWIRENEARLDAESKDA